MTGVDGGADPVGQRDGRGLRLDGGLGQAQDDRRPGPAQDLRRAIEGLGHRDAPAVDGGRGPIPRAVIAEEPGAAAVAGVPGRDDPAGGDGQDDVVAQAAAGRAGRVGDDAGRRLVPVGDGLGRGGHRACVLTRPRARPRIGPVALYHPRSGG